MSLALEILRELRNQPPDPWEPPDSPSESWRPRNYTYGMLQAELRARRDNRIYILPSPIAKRDLEVDYSIVRDMVRWATAGVPHWHQPDRVSPYIVDWATRDAIRLIPNPRFAWGHYLPSTATTNNRNQKESTMTIANNTNTPQPIIGTDGFIVPADFAEFRRRFPLMIPKFVRRMNRATSDERRDIYEQSLTAWMRAGKDGKDRIQWFKAHSAEEATIGRFLNYVNFCMMNHLCSASRAGAVTTQLPVLVDDEYLYMKATECNYSSISYDKIIEDGVFESDYVAYVQKHNLELLRIVTRLQVHQTFAEVQRELGLTERDFYRGRNRLVVLLDSYLRGEEPPQQRRAA